MSACFRFINGYLFHSVVPNFNAPQERYYICARFFFYFMLDSLRDLYCVYFVLIIVIIATVLSFDQYWRQRVNLSFPLISYQNFSIQYEENLSFFYYLVVLTMDAMIYAMCTISAQSKHFYVGFHENFANSIEETAESMYIFCFNL